MSQNIVTYIHEQESFDKKILILSNFIAAYGLRLNSRAGIEGSTVSSLICDR